MTQISLKSQKNLLAFSAGVDSTALFFILQKNSIPFDIAIVNYNLREQSILEVEYAKELAKKYNKTIHIKELTLDGSNFEKRARDIRYSFFEELIKEYNYETLLTAHQLNDKLEWFFMQLSKGAGLSELLGLSSLEKRDTYQIFRPLLDFSKDELEEYLKKENIRYFIDESNYDTKYRRNYFRHNFSNKFLEEFKSGVINSLNYLEKDLNSLNLEDTLLFRKERLEIFKNLKDDNLNIRVIDKAIKKRGYILSKNQRDEILRQKESVVDKFAISILDSYIWISPLEDMKMSKKFKELCRVKNIPKKHRAYLYKIDSTTISLDLLQFVEER